MKEKILSALKTKYSNFGFSDKAFTGVAEYLASTVTEEDQIDNSISGVETLLKAFQGDIDTRVSSAVAKAKAEKGGNNPQPKKEEDDKGDDPMLALLKEMKQEISTLKAERQQETLAQKWNKAVSDKGIKNDKLRDKWMPNSEDEFENNLNDLVEFNKTISIQEANGSATGKPASGASSTEKVSKETQSKIDSWSKSKEDSSAKQD